MRKYVAQQGGAGSPPGEERVRHLQPGDQDPHSMGRPNVRRRVVGHEESREASLHNTIHHPFQLVEDVSRMQPRVLVESVQRAIITKPENL